jgi:hypothetical protein
MTIAFVKCPKGRVIAAAVVLMPLTLYRPVVTVVAYVPTGGGVIGEVTLRSRDRNLEYCLLSRERNPVRKNPQLVVVLRAFGPALCRRTDSTAPRGLRRLHPCHCLTVYTVTVNLLKPSGDFTYDQV